MRPLSFTCLDQPGLRWTVGESTFDVLPENGARLMRWRHAGRDIIHWPETPPTGLPIDAPASAADIPGAYGGNPILFPFAARCFDDGEPLYWRTPGGERRPMPMHGIARQGRFAVSIANAGDNAGENGFTATFLPDAAAREAYPYDYTFTVRYRFLPLGLTCEFVLRNHEGHHPIPWSAGHHFYFALPLSTGPSPALRRTGFRIQIPATRACVVSMHTQGKLLPHPLFPEDNSLASPQLADAIIHHGLRSNEARLYPISGDSNAPLPPLPSITLTHGVAPVPPPEFAFVTWSPSPEAPFYCVEPWMGPSNAPGHGTGLHWVPPGEQRSWTVGLQLTHPA
ncbi:aldose epimerase [Opitutaceae bacterium TAV4]|nr:aldose epimerase [Opitutaceae bacterium TAV4]RRK02014.1 aldose epimerase [Opitutaceae bacterium TAV3]